MPSTTVPDRLTWAIDRLDVRPDQRILEVGCGPGVAARLIADRLDGGVVIGVDRSATAVTRATKRNKEHITAGRAQFHTTDLTGYDHTGPRFDTVVAMNVNLFWTGPATAEWRRIDELLASQGRLFLFYGYGPGDPTAGRDIAGPLTKTMRKQGLEPAVHRAPDGSSICVTGHRPG
jgi:cyclopropane fatty-acyl-phospholipid synthase-like methyltransferase